jgi:hypothetical protein
MLQKVSFQLLVAAAVLLLACKKCQAWGGFHAGYTHFGAGGFTHYGYNGYRGGYAGDLYRRDYYGAAYAAAAGDAYGEPYYGAPDYYYSPTYYNSCYDYP